MENPVQVTTVRRTNKWPVFEFNGERYYKKPPGYYKMQWGPYLHRSVWEFHNGPIPEGYVVHHIDGERDHNDLENLQCMPSGEHGRMHMDDPGRKESSRQNIHGAIVAAVEWRRRNPDLAKAIGEKGGAGTAARLARIGKSVFRCDHCGDEYKAYPRPEAGTGYCSKSCVTAARVARGVDDEDRKCVVCDDIFRANRYTDRKTCALACKRALLSRVRLQRRG